MADMTIAVDEQLLRAARIEAVQRGTSVNEISRRAVEAFARGAGEAEARSTRLRALARKVRSDSAPLRPGRAALHADSAER